jgi:hypothetical protein
MVGYMERAQVLELAMEQGLVLELEPEPLYLLYEIQSRLKTLRNPRKHIEPTNWWILLVCK